MQSYGGSIQYGEMNRDNRERRHFLEDTSSENALNRTNQLDNKQ